MCFFAGVPHPFNDIFKTPDIIRDIKFWEGKKQESILKALKTSSVNKISPTISSLTLNHALEDAPANSTLYKRFLWMTF